MQSSFLSFVEPRAQGNNSELQPSFPQDGSSPFFYLKEPRNQIPHLVFTLGSLNTPENLHLDQFLREILLFLSF